MGRFHGAIGFGDNVEVAPGIWDDVIVEKRFYGDIVLNNHTFTSGEGVNDNPDLNASISIVGSRYAFTHIKQMRYLRWDGQLWVIDSLELKRPRIILRLGAIYNGPPVASSPIT